MIEMYETITAAQRFYRTFDYSTFIIREGLSI